MIASQICGRRQCDANHVWQKPTLAKMSSATGSAMAAVLVQRAYQASQTIDPTTEDDNQALALFLTTTIKTPVSGTQPHAR